MKISTPNVGLPLLAKELAELAGRPRTYAIRVGFAAMLILLAAVLFVPSYRAAQQVPFGLLGQGRKLLDVLYEVEWLGLCLFIPAVVSGALAAEKERHTLQLLFLTRLGPWNVLLEKLLSRFVPAATFLLISLPLLFIAYLMGGVTQADVEYAGAGLVVTAFEVACISLFCSAFCATSTSAFVTSYCLTAITFAIPALSFACMACADQFVFQTKLLGKGPGLQRDAIVDWWINSAVAIDLDWLIGDSSAAAHRPFHMESTPLLGIVAVGVIFLALSRVFIVRRASLQPKHRVRQLFLWLDQMFHRLNERYGRGIVLSRARVDLPDDRPILWRENRRGNLGQVRHLIRILVVLEFFVILVSSYSATILASREFDIMHLFSFLLWLVAALVVVVRSAGLVGAEKARQTLDVLLTTPLTLSELAGEKLRGILRVIIFMSIPILTNAILVGWMSNWKESGGMLVAGRDSATNIVLTLVSLAILLPLIAQVAFLAGLRTKTQGTAVMATMGILTLWCAIPVIVSAYAGWGGKLMLSLSPATLVLIKEYPDIGYLADMSSHRFADEFWSIVATSLFMCFGVLVVLRMVNRRIARKILVRP